MARPKTGYASRSGTPLPGVTTICGLLDKPALVGWAGKRMYEAALVYGTACYIAGQTDGEVSAMPKWQDVLYGERDQAASDGTRAHDLFAAFLNGEAPTRDESISDSAWQAFENAQHWFSTSGLEIESHERPIVSEELGFGGTPDALIHDQNGNLFLGDWKTGRVFPNHLIQMGGYALLIKDSTGRSVQGCHLVSFKRDRGGFSHHFWGRDELALGVKVFTHLLRLYPTLREIERIVR